jgi:hypothetical protein
VKKEKYVDSYGPPVPVSLVPYSLGQLIQFENGLGDTLTFKCTTWKQFEQTKQGPCQNEDNCTTIYHEYFLEVNLEELNHTKNFLITAIHENISGHYTTYPNSNPDPLVGRFLYYLSPSSLWSNSINLNGKTYYDYQTTVGVRQVMSEPGTPLYSDTTRYSQNEGLIMFGSEKKSGSTVLFEERWVLVK